MKKRIIVVTLLGVAFILLGFQIYNALRLNRCEGASMAVVAGSAHSEGATIEITNHTAEKLCCGSHSKVRLQKKILGLWVPLWWNFTSAHTGEGGPTCDAGESCEQKVSWKGGHGAQDAGHYRVLQKVWTKDASGERGKTHVISAEFTIP